MTQSLIASLIAGTMLFLIVAIPAYIFLVNQMLQIIRERHPELWREIGRPDSLLRYRLHQSTSIIWLVLGRGFARIAVEENPQLRRLGNVAFWILLVGCLLMAFIVVSLVLHAGLKFGGGS